MSKTLCVHMFHDAPIGKMKRTAPLVNSARAKICDRVAIVRALEIGQVTGSTGVAMGLQEAAASALTPE